MADEPLQPDWIGHRDELGRDVPDANQRQSGSHRQRAGGPGSGSGSTSDADAGTPGSTRAVPRDVPVSVGEEAAVDAPVEVRRFAGLANRALAVAVPVTIAVLGVLAMLVAFAGASGLLNGRGGTAVASAAGAVQPVPATETLLMFGVDDNQDLTGVSLLGMTPAATTGSSDALASSSVLVLGPDLAVSTGAETLATLWAADPSAVLDEVAGHFNVAISDVVIVDPQAQAAIASAIGPVTVRLAEPLLAGSADGSAVPVFAAGDVTLAGADVARFSSPLAPGENRVAHLDRQRTLWLAIQEAVKASDDISGLDPVLTPFLSGLADPRSQVLVADVAAQSALGQTPRLELDDEDTSARLFSVVPNPLAAPGRERPSVRVLDASGDEALLLELRRQIAALGGRTVAYGAVGGRDGMGESRVVAHRGPGGDESEGNGNSGTDGTDPQLELTRVLAVALGVESESDFAPDEPLSAPAFEITVVIGSERVQDGGE